MLHPDNNPSLPAGDSLLYPQFSPDPRRFGVVGPPTLRSQCRPAARRARPIRTASDDRAGHTHLLARDLLGVNKLFYAIGRDGAPICSNYWFELIRWGFSLDAIRSLPSGHFAVFKPDATGPRLQRYASLVFGEDRAFSELHLASYVRDIQVQLREVFQIIRRCSANQRLYVSLSGGLDSTGIAVLARETLGRFTAVTFAVMDAANGSSASEDLINAERVAAELGVRFRPVVVPREHVLESLDLALLYGQDWREFNVHCPLVNVALGQAIREDCVASHAIAPPLLLTGDVMNELMADYAPIVYSGKQPAPAPVCESPSPEGDDRTGLGSAFA